MVVWASKLGAPGEVDLNAIAGTEDQAIGGRGGGGRAGGTNGGEAGRRLRFATSEEDGKCGRAENSRDAASQGAVEFAKDCVNHVFSPGGIFIGHAA